MIQLSSIDNVFIQAEKPHLPMHVSSVSIYDPSTSPQGIVRFKDIMRMYKEAIHDLPLLRRRLVHVPGGMDLPYWIEDPNLDIEFHVRHLALPKPGDWRQFYIQLARLHSRGLDTNRPLWEVYVIEGLNNLDGIAEGSFAVMLKLHHAAVDGDSLLRVLLSMHDFEPKAPRPPRTDLAPLMQEQAPGKLPLLLKSYKRSLQRPVKLTKTLNRIVKSRRKINEARKKGELPEELTAGSTHFQGKISPHRVVTSASFDFKEFKQLRHAVPGATINDLAINIISGALRFYLESKGEPLEEALITQIPVNIRQDSQKGETNNQIANIDMSSCSNIADPLERLETIHKASSSGKKQLGITGTSINEDMADALGPQITKTIFSYLENSSQLKSLFNSAPSGPNFAFSNMAGPPVPVYLCGARYSWGIGLGPLMPNQGLFITANSSEKQFVFGVTACRSLMPDPDFFQECLLQSYDESSKSLRQLAVKNDPHNAAAPKKDALKRPKLKE
ncbi:MAG: wax ester/triacylglycerol synthase family O-acyltransferase [Halioglobus sp.]